MASSLSFLDYFCDQISGVGEVRYRKMFGEYMVYINNKPVFLVCDDTVYVKTKDETTELLQTTAKGSPYKGAKEHYILDIDNAELTKRVAILLERITPLPKPKKRSC